MKAWSNPLTGIATSLNLLHPRVWAVAIICLGTYLILRGHNEAGIPLITGAFALLTGNKDPSAATSTEAARTVPPLAIPATPGKE